MLFSALSSVSSNPTSIDDAKTAIDEAGRRKKSERPNSEQIARGTVIGRYTILDHLGSGGMASV